MASSTPYALALRVIDALEGDIGSGIVRLEQSTQNALGVTAWDVVEIWGPSRVPAIAHTSIPEDWGKAIMRLESLLRDNGGLKIGDSGFVRRTQVNPAKSLFVAPAQIGPTLVTVDASYLAPQIVASLQGRPFVEGNQFEIPGVTVATNPVRFIVLSTEPKDVVVVDESTTIDFGPRGPGGPAPPPSSANQLRLESRSGLLSIIVEMARLRLYPPAELLGHGFQSATAFLLYGEPGTGKTSMARDVASRLEVDATFLQLGSLARTSAAELARELSRTVNWIKGRERYLVALDDLDLLSSRARRDWQSIRISKALIEFLDFVLRDDPASHSRGLAIGICRSPDLLDQDLKARFGFSVELGPSTTADRFLLLSGFLSTIAEHADDPYIDEMARAVSNMTSKISVRELNSLVIEAIAEATARQSISSAMPMKAIRAGLRLATVPVQLKLEDFSHALENLRKSPVGSRRSKVMR